VLITLLQKQVYKVKTKIRNAFSTKINSVGLPILSFCVCFGELHGLPQRRLNICPLAAIRQFIGGILYVCFSCIKAPWPRKAMENNNHLEYFALSNGLSTWVKHISGLGAILNAVFPCGCNHYFF
jgi:hypothetical protein